jgi:hypothetical protein
VLLGAAGAAEGRHARTGGVESDHRLVRRDGQQQRSVGIAVAQDRIDLEDGMRRIGRVGAHALVHDPFEHCRRNDPHGADLARLMSEDDAKHVLPPIVAAARADVADDPDGAEQRGLALMTTSGTAIVAGVEQHAATYVLGRVNALLDAWGRVPPDVRLAADEDLRRAALDAQRRVVSELRALFAFDPGQQARTPLEIVRTLREEPTKVLSALGVGEIVRDEFEERALPNDPYGLAPRTLGELGDVELGPMLLAWGLGKATVMRARIARARGGAGSD